MRHPFLTPTVAMIIALGVLPLAAQSVPAAAVVAPTPQLAYQGHLLEAGVAANGARVFVFSLRDATGLELWSSGNQTVTVSDGLYSVVLGSTGMPAISPPVLAQSGLKLHVVIGGVAMAPDVELIPAFQSRSAWELVGAFSGDVTGTQTQSIVSHLQGIPVDLTTVKPTAGQGLLFDGTKFVPSTVLGTAGPQGPVGATGPQGAKGDTGATGAQGLQGVQGVQGFAGATGAAGAAGANGKTLLNGAGAPTASGAAGTAGDFYLDTTNNLLFGPKAGDSWVGLKGLSLVGPQGPTGPTGPTGAQGPQGVQGFTGATGAQGAQGSAGASPFTLTGSDAVYTAGRVGIGTAPTSASALLELGSTTQGLLAPRMTAAQRTAIAAPGTPATGLLVFQTDSTAGFYYYNGSAWAGPLASSSANGTVTSVATGTGLTGGPITGTGTVALANTAVSPGSYARANVTVDQQGRLTAASSGSAVNLATEVTGTLPVTSGGTGATSASGARNALLPAQTGNGGLFLTTNGSGVSWDSPLGLVGLDNFRNTFQGKTALTSPTGWDNTAYGYGTLAAGAGATANTGLGTLAFSAVVSGSSNVGVGSRAGYLQLGSDNTAVGGSALYGATPSGTNTGSRNSAFGLESLFKNTTGDSNTALGAQALYSNTTSTKNIAVGYQAGYNLTTGNYNIAIGHLGVAAEANTLRLGTAASGTGASMTGQNRAFIAGIRGATLGGSSPQTVVIDENGQLSSAASTSGTVTSVAALTLTSSSGTDLSSTVATGASTPVITLNVPTASASNRGALSATDWSTFNGKESALTFSSPLSRSTNTISLGTVGVANGGTGLTAGGANGQVLAWASGAPAWQERIPSDAGENTRGGALSLGSLNGGVFNTGFGYQSLAVLTTAGWSTAVGHNALASVTTGSNNTAVGKGALLSVTGGNDNAAVGANALCGLIGGTYNTVMGNYALTQATQVSNSVAMGAYALAYQIGGYENTAVGYSALSSLNTGSDNLALGYLAGLGGTYGSNNIYLGANSAASAAGTAGSSITNEIVIGSGATGKGSKTTLLGTPGTTTKTFIAGISGVTPAGSDTAQMVVIKTSGQLGAQDIPAGSGTVTSVSVTSAKGFGGSVATASATPAITLSTSVNGLLKGDGTGLSAASPVSDYQAPLTFISPLSNAANTVSLGTVPSANGGTGLSTYTKGDVLYHDGTQFQKLAAGSTSAMLIMGPGGVPAWSVTGAGAITGNIWTMTTDTAVLSAATETAWIGSGLGQGSLTIPAGAWTPGKTLRVRLGGTAAKSGTSTCRLYLRLTSAVTGTVVQVADTGVVGTSAGGWTAEFTVTCRATTGANNFASIANLLLTQSSSLGGATNALVSTVSNLNTYNQTIDVSGLCANTDLKATICTVEILN